VVKLNVIVACATKAELREEMLAKETSNSESLACVEECLRKKFEQDSQYYKDQISRLEATVAAHHERLGRVLKVSRRAKQQQQGNSVISRLFVLDDDELYSFYFICPYLTNVCLQSETTVRLHVLAD